MLCSHCPGLVFTAVIRATQCCLTVPHYCLFAVLYSLFLLYFWQINDHEVVILGSMEIP